MGGVIAGQPGLEVALSGRRQVQAVSGEPVQQCHGGSEVIPDATGLGKGGVFAVVTAPEPSQRMPDGVVVQHPLLVVVGDGGRDPQLQAGQVLVAGR